MTKQQNLWVALSLVNRLGSKTLEALLAHFEHDPQAIVSASSEDLQHVHGVGPRIAAGIQALDLAQIEAALEYWTDEGVSIVTSRDPGSSYPPRLLGLEDAPPSLFMLGNWQAAYDRAVAVVGTRHPSAEAAAFQLGEKLAAAGIAVVSGLARGIDTAAHQGALSAGAGLTVAVLGCGVLNLYPPENSGLINWRLGQGLLLSEVAPDTPPSSARLVARNRLISGLSCALVVVETEVNGGAMYAARFAREQGRPVYALDLPTSGNRELLRRGASPLHADLSNLETLFEDLCHA